LRIVADIEISRINRFVSLAALGKTSGPMNTEELARLRHNHFQLLAAGTTMDASCGRVETACGFHHDQRLMER
jgi:hypothetical protein